MGLSKFLRDHSRTIAGKEQLIIGAVAKALEVIPRQLCENAGFDSTNILNRLRQMHSQGSTPTFPSSLFSYSHSLLYTPPLFPCSLTYSYGTPNS